MWALLDRRSYACAGNTELTTTVFWLHTCTFNPAKDVKLMTYIPNYAGWVSTEDSRRILHAIFPNYPELNPCNAVPTLEPIAPSAEKATL